MKGFTLVLLIGVLSFSYSEAACAGCSIRHAQQHYCDADFAMNITILENLNYEGYKYRLYQGRILKSWKEGPSAGGKFQFFTKSSICGTYFVTGKTYVITGTRETNVENGEKIWLHDSCDYSSLVSEMSDQQTLGFKREYKRAGCGECQDLEAKVAYSTKVEYMENDYSSAATYWTPTGCYYNPKKTQEFQARSGFTIEDCENLYGLCQRNQDGDCEWKLTDQYEACFKHRDDAVIVASGDFAVSDIEQCDALTNKRKKRKCKQQFNDNEDAYEDMILTL